MKKALEQIRKSIEIEIADANQLADALLRIEPQNAMLVNSANHWQGRSKGLQNALALVNVVILENLEQNGIDY